MDETKKSLIRRSYDIRFATRYFVGDGIDVGAGRDSLGFYTDIFPMIKSVKAWDLEDGDAQFLQGVSEDTFDFVHSSHCLEHMKNPEIALTNWVKVCKAGGHLIITIPDEDLYEQGIFPSRFNGDHKHTFAIKKQKSWSCQSINVFDLLSSLNISRNTSVLKVELLDMTYRYGGNYDQTMDILGESAIEIILKKNKR
jgi:SAM-dependent methyltransferase